ncbi:MAG: restriction endonuclease [Nitrospirota bacterium]|jgi:hypothetical protein
MKPGKSLEHLIYLIETAVADKEDVTVESPIRLRDKVSGNLREHDVVLTIRQQHHEFKIAIECRDRATKVGSGQVEAFSTKCRDTGINQGIIVSPKGFTEPALKKAAAKGIRCLNLDKAVTLDWLLAPGIEVAQRHIIDIIITLFTEGGIDFKNCTVLNINGRELSKEDLRKLIHWRIKQIMDQSPIGDDETHEDRKLMFNMKGLIVRENRSGKLLPIRKIRADVEYQVERKMVPFTLYTYGDKSKKEDFIDAATARVEMGSVAADIVLTYKKGEGGKVIFAPLKKNAKTRKRKSKKS